MTALFTDESAVSCLTDGMDWTPELTEQVMGDCRTKLEGRVDQCRCYADKMKAEVSMHDFYVVGIGRDGGAEISARIEAHAADWWLACTSKSPKKRR